MNVPEPVENRRSGIRLLRLADEPLAPALRHRGISRDGETERVVAEIVADVRSRGDAALLDAARRFDAPGLTSVVVTDEEMDEAEVSEDRLAALEAAAARVRAFHEAQRDALSQAYPGGGWRTNEPTNQRANEAFVAQRLLPVERAGVYVPGGRAAYPSSVLMNVLPAQIAGVNGVYVTTPARPDGTLDPLVLAAIRDTGAAGAFKIGGAAAIAALALGTETVPRVDKIVGPGNRFVNEAKRQLWGQVGLDGYAGPSEVAVLADDAANAEFAAADLLTQIEHAPDNAGFLITLSDAKMAEILAAVERQLTGAPRETTMREALSNSLAVVARHLDEALDAVNLVAPEHLTLAVADPDAVLGRVRNAGCVLMGEWTPESAGDYCLGPSHTLPTGGAARWQSPVNVLDFLKVQSVVRMSRDSIQPLIPIIETLATAEGFPAHARGATLRRNVAAVSDR